MKVRVVISIDIDPAAYRESYGDRSDAEIREDVQWSAFNAVANTTFPSDENDNIIRNTELKSA